MLDDKISKRENYQIHARNRVGLLLRELHGVRIPTGSHALPERRHDLINHPSVAAW